MFLKSLFKTSEGFLVLAGTVLKAVVPDFPVEALGLIGSYVIGRSWVKAKNGITK